MTRRTGVLGAVITLICLPAVMALVAAVSFSVRNRTNESMVSAGEHRRFILYVPDSYNPEVPTALILSMHGAGGWAGQQRAVSGWNRLADAQGFIVAYPSGRDHSGPRTWRVQEGTGLAKDVRFLSDLIGSLEQQYNIDPKRIYANGLSNGGGMSWALSCTLSDRIAAVGLVAPALTLPWSWCTDRKPVPMIMFHGTADLIVPYKGGTSWIARTFSFPDISEWVAKWARRNRCGTDPTETTLTTDVTRRTYDNCSNNADVVLYTVQDGGHTWPGGLPLPEWFAGKTTTNVSATDRMWEFFEDHPLVTRLGED